jgi:hypothetical protein
VSKSIFAICGCSKDVMVYFFYKSLQGVRMSIKEYCAVCLILILSLTLQNPAYAKRPKGPKPLYVNKVAASALPAGSKIVAGREPGEFFIIGKEKTVKVNQRAIVAENHKLASSIYSKLAMHKKAITSKNKLALHGKQHKSMKSHQLAQTGKKVLAASKHHAGKKLALSKNKKLALRKTHQRHVMT